MPGTVTARPGSPGNYLSAIVDWHRARAAEDTRDVDELLTAAKRTTAPRPFAGALTVLAGSRGAAVIAEIKRRSPSKGDIFLALDPATLAADYAAGGAACLSVLTDGPHFGGSAEDLGSAHSATTLPVLRKDFTVVPADVCDARLMGADAVLLIVAALGDTELVELSGVASALGLAALVEVHDRDELERALAAGASLVGVNQRDLATFAVDPERAASLAPHIPTSVVAVAESGIRGRSDVERLADTGYQGVLVGEHLVRSSDRRAAVRDLTGCRIGARTNAPRPAANAG